MCFGITLLFSTIVAFGWSLGSGDLSDWMTINTFEMQLNSFDNLNLIFILAHSFSFNLGMTS